MTKWVLLGAGAVLAVWGLYWGWTGWTIVEVERGWSAVVSGAAVFSAGAIISAMGALCWQLEQLVKTAGLNDQGKASRMIPPQAGSSVVVVTAPAQSAGATLETATAAAAAATAATVSAAAIPPVSAPVPAPVPAPVLAPEAKTAPQTGAVEPVAAAPQEKIQDKIEPAGDAPPQPGKAAAAPPPSRSKGDQGSSVSKTADSEKPWLLNPGQAFVKTGKDTSPAVDGGQTDKPELETAPETPPPPRSPRVIIPPPRGPVQFRVIEGAQAQEAQADAPAANGNSAVPGLGPQPSQPAPSAETVRQAPPAPPDEKRPPPSAPVPPAAAPAAGPDQDPAPVELPPAKPRRPMPPLAPLTMNTPWPPAPDGVAKTPLAASTAAESGQPEPPPPAPNPPPAPEPASALDKLMAEFDALPQQIQTAAISPADVSGAAARPEQEPPVEAPTPEPAKPEVETPDAAATAARSLVREYESQGIRYFLYSDGSVDAHAPSGVYQFASLEELRIYIESRGAR